jgi:predicted  nucleic acid-binding Zn-ribbon protein
MTTSTSSKKVEWTHHCLSCGKVFDSAKLNESCPNCENTTTRQTRSHNWYLDENYGIMTPEEWSTAIGIEDLTNPVDTPDGE